MTFSNSLLEPSQLARVSDIEFTPVEQIYVKIRRVIALVTIMVFVLVMAVAVFVIPNIWPSAAEPVRVFTAVPLFLSLWIGGYCLLADPKKCYAMREHDLSYQSGLLFRKTITQPITRVQHVEVKQGPIERKYGLASLLAYSAGGQMHTFHIPGLPHEVATKMRAYVLEHKQAVRSEQ